LKPNLKAYREELHISHSQIFTYLSCSLKYQFQYLEQRPQERMSLALPFGKAIHVGIERYYRSIMESGAPAGLDVMSDLFEESLTVGLENATAPIIFKQEAEDAGSAINLGKSMLKAFHESVDLTGWEVAAVELPLAAPLYTPEGERLDIQLIGAIDLLLKDTEGRYLVVDNKTSKQKKTQEAVDDDHQMTAYSYLLATNGYVFPRAEVSCRFDVLRKLKTPTFEKYTTSRTAEHRKRFARIASAVLNGIESRLFIPTKGWLCSDCQYQDACSSW
jgi:putative RecB family exonuclease